MITVNTILIYHSLDCNKILPIIGDKKLEKVKTNITFDSEKEVREFWTTYAKLIKIDKSNIDFYTKGDSCILK